MKISRYRLKFANKALVVFLAVVIAFLMNPGRVYARGAVSISALDTIESFETEIIARNLSPNQNGVLRILKPDMSVYEIAVRADEQGIAQTVIPEEQTGKAGQYRVMLTGTDGFGYFRVFPSDLTASAPHIFASADSSGGGMLISSAGGDPEPILIAQAGQPVNRFVIENLPASVQVNDMPPFTVKAVDSNGAVVSSYTGAIHFTSTDTNAVLPGDYTFVAADQGQKTFSLVLNFRTAGSQMLTVTQQGNTVIRGERTVQVLPRSTPSGPSGQVRITRPAAGSYTSNTMDVAGEASPNQSVSIYDNNNLIGQVTAGSDGRFVLTNALFRDGQHVIKAEANSVMSETVTINIDSTPARVESVEIDEDEVAPGTVVGISIRSDPDLTAVTASVGEFITDLQRDPLDPSMYHGSLTAPAQDGEYTVNVNLTDVHGNATQAAEVARLRVDAELANEGNDSASSVPSMIQGVVASPGDGKITLMWQAASAESGIAFYRVYYGTDGNNPNLVANTSGPAISLEIDNLQNGSVYYFQVVGVDNDGNEGDNRSNTASASPQAGLGAPGAGTAPVLCDPGPCPPDAPYPPSSPEDGPEVLGALIASLFGGALYKRFKKK